MAKEITTYSCEFPECRKVFETKVVVDACERSHITEKGFLIFLRWFI